MPELENPIESPCFGCGPTHARGLRLRFEETKGGDGTAEVRSTFTPKPDEVGWPTLFHQGLHFMVLNEVSYWAALTLTGQLWVMVGPATYTSERLPRVAVAHVARARIVRRETDRLGILATTTTVEGRHCGSLDSTWRPASRAIVERAKIPLPEYLLSNLAP
jgi:hypothetical protein